MKIIKILQLASLLIMNIDFIIATPLQQQPCGNAYGQKPCMFLPAPSGHTPKCATPGSTFCEHVDDYPENLIKKLLKSYVSRDILANEEKIDFSASDRKEVNYPYGPPSSGSFNHHGNFYGSATPNHHFNNNFNNHPPHPGHRQHEVNQMPSKSSAGYHYPRPGSTSHNFFDIKPPFSSQSSNYADYYRRATREIQPFINANGTLSSGEKQEANQMTFVNRFLNAIIPPSNRTKRQMSPDREQLCQTRSSYINPQAALNVKGNWMYIVNGGEAATQLVRTEICLSSQCSNLCQLPNGYNSRCEQKYVQKRLVTLDPEGQKLFTDTFWFPSCCVCTLSNV